MKTRTGVLLGTGAVAPGASRILTSRNARFNRGTTLSVELNGTVPGSGYDQLGVNGTVALSNAFLTISLGFDPSVGAAFTIVSNGDLEAVLGAFNGRPEGAIMAANGKPCQNTYTGGSGNDGVLTRVSPPSTLTSINKLGNWHTALQATGGLCGFGHSIEAATNLSPLVQWSDIGSATADGNGAISFTDTNARLFSTRFYHAVYS